MIELNMEVAFVSACAASFLGFLVFYIIFDLLLDKKTTDESGHSQKSEPFAYGVSGILLGMIERFFFVFAIIFGYPAFPLLWVGLKVGVQSKEWTADNNRDLLNAYLIMNLISVAVGYVCAWGALGFADHEAIMNHFNHFKIYE